MIYFVRHGKTDYNKKNLLSGGDIDIPLNSEGKDQAKITAKLLKDVKFDMVFCSPLIRAKKTCEEIMKFHKNIPVIYDSRIVELKCGKNNGIVASEFDKYMFVLCKTPKEGIEETIYEYYNRCADFLKDICAKYKDKDILVVAHNGVCAMFKWYFYGEPKEQDLRNYFCENCEVVEFKFD